MVCKKDRWEKRKDINLDVLTGVINFEVQRKQQHKGSSYYVWILQNHAKMFEIFPPGFWCWSFFGQSFPINRSWVALKGNIEWVFVLVSVLLMWPKYMVKMNIQRSGRIGGGIWIFVCLFLTAWEAATTDAKGATNSLLVWGLLSYLKLNVYQSILLSKQNWLFCFSWYPC